MKLKSVNHGNYLAYISQTVTVNEHQCLYVNQVFLLFRLGDLIFCGLCNPMIPASDLAYCGYSVKIKSLDHVVPCIHFLGGIGKLCVNKYWHFVGNQFSLYEGYSVNIYPSMAGVLL